MSAPNYCQTLGHNWVMGDVAKLSSEVFSQSLECERCGEKRSRTISSRGDLLTDTHPNEPNEMIE